MTNLINTPFADSGDKATIPVTDAAGNVNWSQGFPADYSKDPDTDPSAKRIERDDFNGLLNYITAAIREIQVRGVTPFITAADNGGTAYAYDLGVLVFYNNAVWRSSVAANTAIPSEGANWSKIIGNSDLGTAAFATLGTGTNQVPTMANWTLTGDQSAGYMKMPNGFIIQWGSVTLNDNGSTTVNITYPMAYPNALFQAVATPRDQSNGTTVGVTLYLNGLSSEPATERSTLRISAAGSNIGILSVRWISIGY